MGIGGRDDEWPNGFCVAAQKEASWFLSKNIFELQGGEKQMIWYGMKNKVA